MNPKSRKKTLINSIYHKKEINRDIYDIYIYRWNCDISINEENCAKNDLIIDNMINI